MNKYKNMQSLPSGKQEGAVVITIVLVLLTVLTIIGLTSAKKATVETKMTTNTIDRQKAYLAAEEAVKYAWDDINDNGFDVKKYVSNCNENGVYDLRSSNIVASCTKTDDQGNEVTETNNKNATGWRSVKGPGNWAWDDTETRQVATLSASNPMNIAANPQYRTGIHEAVERKGTEGFQCIPLSVLGVGKGNTANAQVLLEINAIPKGGCFQSKSGF